MKPFWKQPKFLGKSAYLLSKLLRKTCELNIAKHSLVQPDQPYLFAFWHGKQLLPILSLIEEHQTPLCAMASPSKDGDILTELLYNIGYDVIRGSSNTDNIRALLQLKKHLSNGYSVGFGIDGPTGPLHMIKPGIIYLSQKCNVPIIPLGCAIDQPWVFTKAWDQFELIKPFKRSVLYFGEPVIFKNSNDLSTQLEYLKQQMTAAEMYAQALLIKHSFEQQHA